MIILSAERTKNQVHKSRASNSRGYIGLKYERSAKDMLANALPKTMVLERNPWFYYSALDNNRVIKSACSPDSLIFDNEFGFIVVVEIKNTYTPAAIEKLTGLYCPVVQKVFNKSTKPLVLVKNLVPGCPLPKLSLSSALISDIPLMQWLGTGSIRI